MNNDCQSVSDCDSMHVHVQHTSVHVLVHTCIFTLCILSSFQCSVEFLTSTPPSVCLERTSVMLGQVLGSLCMGHFLLATVPVTTVSASVPVHLDR